MRHPAGPDEQERLRALNRRTARTLGLAGAVFFAGTIASQASEWPDTALGVLIAGAVLFVAQAIGGHLREK